MDATGQQSAQLSSELDSEMAKHTNPENWVLAPCIPRLVVSR